MSFHRMCLQALFFVIGMTFIGVTLTSPKAEAFVIIRTPGGSEVHWPLGSQLVFRTNETNRSGMSGSDIFTLFTTSLQRWQQTAFNNFGFVYYQGTDPGRYPNYTGSRQDNSIFFTSNAATTSDQLGCGVIGLTLVWFDNGGGTATKADVRFNDVCYQFTNNPRDTVSMSRIYLGDVGTHELGHALGLDHSQSLQSTMVYTAAAESAYPSCDDRAAMMHLYGGGNNARTGTLSGQVIAPSGQSVFGAHVSAIHTDTGTVMASGLTNPDGTYNISGLEPGTYTVMAEPYFPGASTLNSYYGNISANVCNGSAFSRTFVTDVASGTVRTAFVGAGGSANLGALNVACSAPTSINHSAENAIYSAPVLAAASITTPVATMGALDGSYDQYFRLNKQSGSLEVHAVSFALFSPTDLKVEILDSSGNRLTQTAIDNTIATTASGFVNFDPAALVTLASTQDVIVHVSAKSWLGSNSFPSGSVGVSQSPYYILTASKPSALSVYPDNSRCEAPDSFAPYANRGEAPGFSSGNSNNSSSSGGCGMIYDSSGSDTSGPSGGSPIRMANFALMMLIAAGFSIVRAGQKLPILTQK